VAALVLLGSGRLTAQHEPATAAPATAPQTISRTDSTPPPETIDLETALERIQQRIDEELGPPQPAPARTRTTRRAPAPPRAATAAARPQARPRIHLAWRMQLLWPPDLLEVPPPADSAPAGSGTPGTPTRPAPPAGR
jgi:hypothetical protein